MTEYLPFLPALVHQGLGVGGEGDNDGEEATCSSRTPPASTRQVQFETRSSSGLLCVPRPPSP
jgi:hypothetical protein